METFEAKTPCTCIMQKHHEKDALQAEINDAGMLTDPRAP